MSRATLTLCGALFLQVVSVANAAKPSYSPSQMFKNYALSSCIADAYASEEAKLDASTAAAGYLELGSGPLDAYTEATLLGRTFLAREYLGHKKTSYNTMKCIDFYHSSELGELTAKYFPPENEK